MSDAQITAAVCIGFVAAIAGVVTYIAARSKRPEPAQVGASEESIEPRCMACGRPLPSGARFCPDCGYRQAAYDEAIEIGRPPSEPEAPRQAEVEEQKKSSAGAIILVVVLAIFFLGFVVSQTTPREETYSGTSSSHGSLSESTKREAFYNIVKTQDQNPDSNAWNEGVKEAAAKSYGIPMSEINSIIREGATNHWLTPPPP
jgi:hypothetical protein